MKEAHGVTSETTQAFLGTEQGYTSLVKEDLSQPQTTTAAKVFFRLLNQSVTTVRKIQNQVMQTVEASAPHLHSQTSFSEGHLHRTGETWAKLLNAFCTESWSLDYEDTKLMNVKPQGKKEAGNGTDHGGYYLSLESISHQMYYLGAENKTRLKKSKYSLCP
ncbi:hypothetical protein MKW98_009201 [Papaver atlanticum]|uniref:Uncharacterized protein n=1 Tax=Papaver atlanticum TaxID=357466 RepID=A0AAD4T5A9_9MAGN|nr:hypothetical protein MKW98_009201 [Papaver atlanticum]